MGLPARDITNLYRTDAEKIFKKKNKLLFWKPYYDLDVLSEMARIYFNIPISSIKKTRLMMYATKISKPIVEPRFWKSWSTDSSLLKDAIAASCSAPIYFKAKAIGEEIFVDGGLIDNNPSMCAIAEAIRLGGTLDNVYNVNFDCGIMGGLSQAYRYTWALDWLPVLPSICINSGSVSTEYQAHQLIGFRNHVIRPNKSFALDSLNFSEMDKQVDIMWETHKMTLLSNLL
jgi:hypothetical protein